VSHVAPAVILYEAKSRTSKLASHQPLAASALHVAPAMPRPVERRVAAGLVGMAGSLDDYGSIAWHGDPWRLAATNALCRH